MDIDSFSINVQALAEMRSSGTEHSILDVREEIEIEICAIKDSLFIPMQIIPEKLGELPLEHPLIVMCHHGGRSASVTEFLRNNGFANAYNLEGGIDAWAASVDEEMVRY